MILEAMFCALGARRIVFALRDARTDVLTGRFGLGEGSEAAVRPLAVPLRETADLFTAPRLEQTQDYITGRFG